MIRVVLGMRQHVPDEQFSAIEVDGGDQPKLVPADVEHGEVSDLIGRVERRPHVRKTLPFGMACDLVPRFERRLELRSPP